MLQTRSRRLRDLDRWQASGWLTPNGANALRAEFEASRTSVRLAHVLAILAAVLIGFAAMSFVAANWQEMSKLLRLAIIFASLWALLALAGWAWLREHRAFGEAAALAAVALYGAGIMLIAQMYHMSGHPPDAVLLWGVGTLAAGLLTRCNPVLAAALVLFVVWSFMETFMQTVPWPDRHVHWAFLLAWAVVAVGFAWTRWRPGLHLLCVALTGWIIVQPYQFDGQEQFAPHAVVSVIGLAFMAASTVAGAAIDRWRPISDALLIYGSIIAYAGAFAMQFIVDQRGNHTLLLGVLTLAAILGALAWAWYTDNRGALWVAYAVFSVEIFALYIKKIGTLLGTSVFFLMIGLMVAALAAVAYRLHSGTRARLGVMP
jgi:uncharacterized membrane protein